MIATTPPEPPEGRTPPPTRPVPHPGPLVRPAPTAGAAPGVCHAESGGPAPAAAPGPGVCHAESGGPAPAAAPGPGVCHAESGGAAPTPAPAARPTAAVVRDALAVGVTVGVSGAAFGVAGVGGHLTVAQTCALSLLAFTGASQFALVAALASGAAPLAAVAGALFLGVRNSFYGMRLAERLALPRMLRPLAAQIVIDETTAVTLAQPDRRSARIGFTVTGGCLFVLWNLTTLLGALGAGALGDPTRYGLDAAGPAVFLALLAPRLRDAREREVAALGVVLVLAGTLVLPTGVPVLLALAAVPLVTLLGRRPARTGEGRRDGTGAGAAGAARVPASDTADSAASPAAGAARGGRAPNASDPRQNRSSGSPR